MLINILLMRDGDNWILYGIGGVNAPRVPLCVSANGNCKVNASLTTGYPITVKTWNESRKVMGPSHIDVNYIEKHLNTSKPPEEIIS